MGLYVVRRGDTAYQLAERFGIPLSLLIADNGLTDPGRLVVGQTLVIRFPTEWYTVRPGDTLCSVAQEHQMTVRQLQRRNPALQGGNRLWPGQALILAYEGRQAFSLAVNGYAYPFIDRSLLQSTLPYLTYLTPFTYGFTESGDLIEPDDSELLRAAEESDTGLLLHLSTLTKDGGFSNELAHTMLSDSVVRDILLGHLLDALSEKRFSGLDVDFEYLFPEDGEAFVAFLNTLSGALRPLGLPVLSALPPKTSADQKGLLYEAYDYGAIGAAVSEVLLMTYEWGYRFSPPMAVAPLPSVRKVLEYALTEIPPEKIWLGIPNYGYDWPLPYRSGETEATSISNEEAVALAKRHGAEIQFDETAQSPWFRYRDDQDVEHEVWFEDARSIQAKLELIRSFSLRGAGYWNLMRPFPQNWSLLDSEAEIESL